MNKILLKSFFAVILAMTGILATSSNASAAVYGDVNGDGDVTAADVTMIYNYMLGTSTSSAGCDVNGDGDVTATDVTAVYNILLGVTPQEFEKIYILGDVNAVHRHFVLMRVGLLGRIVVVAGAGGKGCGEQQAIEEVKQFFHRCIVFEFYIILFFLSCGSRCCRLSVGKVRVKKDSLQAF